MKIWKNIEIKICLTEVEIGEMALIEVSSKWDSNI